MPKRTNGYNHRKADAAKDKRRQEAESRQEAYDSLPIAQRIVLAKSRRGESKREVARLQKQLPSSVTDTNPVKKTRKPVAV